VPPQSILAHLAPRLTPQLENVVTDALAYLLKQYPDVRKAFQKYVLKAGVSMPDSLNFETQVSGQDAARPDMVGLDVENRRLLIVESKFWAPLTKNQPTAYIKQLAIDEPALLLFIAPRDNLPTLWRDLAARCGMSNAAAQTAEEDAAPFQVFALAENSRHFLALTSWESLLEALTQQVEDSAALEDIRQLQSLCFSRIWPIRAGKLDHEKLVDTLVDRLVQSDIANIEGYKTVRRPTSYKRYMTLSGLANWCVEYNESHFEQFYPSCLWLTKFLTNADLPQIPDRLTGLNIQSFRQGKTFLTPLLIPDGDKEEVNEAMVLDSLYRQMKDIANQLRQRPSRP
jgi:hypothetical protein